MSPVPSACHQEFFHYLVTFVLDLNLHPDFCKAETIDVCYYTSKTELKEVGPYVYVNDYALTVLSSQLEKELHVVLLSHTTVCTYCSNLGRRVRVRSGMWVLQYMFRMSLIRVCV